MLAVLRRVDAAVAISAPTNLVAWNRHNWHYYRQTLRLRTWRARRWASPFYRWRRSSCPLLLMHSREDRVVHYWQSVSFARSIHSRLIKLKGGHLADRSSGPRSVHWIAHRRGRCLAG